MAEHPVGQHAEPRQSDTAQSDADAWRPHQRDDTGATDRGDTNGSAGRQGQPRRQLRGNGAVCASGVEEESVRPTRSNRHGDTQAAELVVAKWQRTGPWSLGQSATYGQQQRQRQHRAHLARGCPDRRIDVVTQA